MRLCCGLSACYTPCGGLRLAAKQVQMCVCVWLCGCVCARVMGQCFSILSGCICQLKAFVDIQVPIDSVKACNVMGVRETVGDTGRGLHQTQSIRSPQVAFMFIAIIMSRVWCV